MAIRWPWRRQKQVPAAGALVAFFGGGPVWTSRNYQHLAREGYERNGVVYACVGLIARSVAGIPWVLYRFPGSRDRVEEIEEHPLLDLLERPNPWQGQAEFFEALTAFLLLAGNSYVLAVGPERGAPVELHVLRPDRVQVIPDSKNYIAGYKYQVGGWSEEYRNGEVLHLRLFHPTHDWYGLSPIEAAARAVDQDNAAMAWNTALLQNMARPPGALVTQGLLKEEQFERLREQIEQRYAGARNAGRPLLLEGGLDWKQFGLSPAEMDWLNGQKMSARRIASVFGVPPELIGDSESKTYSNYREARKAFYEETVLPLMDRIRDALNRWLVPRFGEGLWLDYDRDEIEALQEERAVLWERAIKAVERGIITPNEARKMLGYDEVPGADVLLVPANMMPLSVISGADGSEE